MPSYDNYDESIVRVVTLPICFKVFDRREEIKNPQRFWKLTGHFLRWLKVEILRRQCGATVIHAGEGPDAVVLEFWLDGDPPQERGHQARTEHWGFEDA